MEGRLQDTVRNFRPHGNALRVSRSTLHLPTSIELRIHTRIGRTRHCAPRRCSHLLRHQRGALRAPSYSVQEGSTSCTSTQISNTESHLPGFVIELGKVSPDPRKVETKREWPGILRDTKQLRGFLGMVGFYRNLISNFNNMAHPRHQLLEDKSAMRWRLAHSRAVHDLKQNLLNGANPRIFDPEKPMAMKTGASKNAIGQSWSRKGNRWPFESRKMNQRDQFLPA